MLSRTHAANIALALTSATVALAICEFIVRFVAPQNLSGTWFIEAAAGPYMVNKSEGTARHQFGARVVHYSFAAPHLRAPKRDGQRKVLVLGDSFTFGLLLADQDTITSRMQTLADIELGVGIVAFLNAGTGGSGTAEHLAYYEDFGPLVGADTILVFLNTDDIGRSLRSSVYSLDATLGALSRSRKVSGFSLKSLVSYLPFYNTALEHSHLLQLARRAFLEGSARSTVGERSPTPQSASGDATRAQRMGSALFARFANLTRERGQRLIVVTTGWHRFTDGGPNEPTVAFMAIAARVFSESTVPFFDISDRVYARARGDVQTVAIPSDGHPNEHGAKLIAEAAWEVLAPQLR